MRDINYEVGLGVVICVFLTLAAIKLVEILQGCS